MRAERIGVLPRDRRLVQVFSGEQLTETPVGSMHYHSAASPDGKWLVYSSKRDGVRQLHVMRPSDKKEHRITDLKRGHVAMWASWQPRAAP